MVERPLVRFFFFIWGLDRRLSASLWSASRSSLSHAKTSVIDRSLNRSWLAGNDGAFSLDIKWSYLKSVCACFGRLVHWCQFRFRERALKQIAQLVVVLHVAVCGIEPKEG